MSILETLPTLVSLRQTGSISRTARALGVPRSTVSRRLARAEEELGVILAERTNRSFRLTPAGELLAGGGADVLARVRTLAESAQAAADGIRGRLRVSAPPGLAGPYLARFLTRFTERFPDVQLEFHVRDQTPHLIDEAFDLVFVIGGLSDAPWVRHRLAPTWYLVVASPGNLEGAQVRTVADLAGHRLLSARQPGLSERAWPGISGEPVPIEPAMVTNDLGILHTLVRQGRGIGLLPVHLVAEELMNGTLLALLTDAVGLELEVSALFSPERRQSPLIRALLETLDVFAAETVAGMAGVR